MDLSSPGLLRLNSTSKIEPANPSWKRKPNMTNYRVLRRDTAILSILVVFALGTARVTQGQQFGNRTPVDAARVERAIESSVDFLLQQQKPDGGWSEFMHYRHGVTSLVTLALLNAGLEPDHPRVSRALQLLDGQELEYTYTVSLQTMAFCTANPAKYASMIKRNAEWLINSQNASGGWSYGGNRGDSPDESNSQFALLALHEAQRTGLKFEDPEKWNGVFENARLYWERIQNGDGSFGYGGSSPRGSMTCAGVASLVIAGAQTDSLESTADQTIMCCGNDDSSKNRIEMGLKWLGDNFTVRHNPNFPSRYHLYYLYALERVGRLTGRRYIGKSDWYREGAEQLINVLQSADGKFSAGDIDGNAYTETAFALLFLSKGKRQTLISRLKYRGSDANDWNHHSTAIQNLTAHTEQAWKRDLSWQNVDLDRSSVKELLETPVLFISGTKASQFTRKQKELLKDYTDQGGFIFVEGCDGDGCRGQEFENYFRKLVAEVWDAQLEKLPQDHPVWFAEARVKPGDLPGEDSWIYGVQTCCRLGIVYVPYSLSCRWELNLPYGAKPDYSELVQNDLNASTKIGINVLAYATGKELKEKLDTVTILEEVKDLTPTRRGVFKFAKLRHNAGYDDAPRAASNLILWLNKTNPFRMSSEKLSVSITKQNLENYPLVFIHGRGRLTFTPKEREVLREYLKNGTIIGDAICADDAFVESFRGEMEIITGKELQPLEISHPMFSRDFGGFDIRSVKMIDPDLSGEGVAAATRFTQPRIEVARSGSRISVLFSPLDLSCALESRHSLQCRGYIREDAARIGINMILYAKLQY